MILAMAIGPAGAIANGAIADEVEIAPADLGAYAAAPDFKALAVSIATSGGGPLARYAFNYDTPTAAAAAALAYCDAARLRAADADHWRNCSLVWIGSYAVMDLDEDHLDAIAERYLEDEIELLRRRLDRNDDRALRLSLATILQKSGRHAQSEALLTDLAAAGDDLARNALAYHWAELNIHLERALAYADSTVAAQPDVASFHDTRGLVLYRLGRLDEALAATGRAIALEPHPIVLDHYGDLLWAAMRCSDARDAWRRAEAAAADILFRQRLAKKIVDGPVGPPVFE